MMRALVCLAIAGSAGAQPFADRVVDYDPVPGQFVGDPAFNDPARALGPPIGAGPFDGGTDSVVTLGGFGGSITLAMSATVWDDPRNLLGLDAIVFGNAFYFLGDPTRRFAEAGLIEIARDANGNGLADDPFFPIAGPQGAGLPLDETMNSAVLDAGPGAELEIAFGYADLSPVLPMPEGESAEVFYTRPDDPTRVGIDPGSGGGDAFDIAWAVLPGTLTRAELDGFDFIRITTGVDAPPGPFGEVSTEIDAVADATPPCPADVNADGAINGSDFFAWVAAFGAGSYLADQNLDGSVDGSDFFAWVAAFGVGCPG
ncbi:MAG: GC-type dockerin domain-anchored protein [Planctomycetota bacterium]